MLLMLKPSMEKDIRIRTRQFLKKGKVNALFIESRQEQLPDTLLSDVIPAKKDPACNIYVVKYRWCTS